jgi:hypothetical protein
MCVGRVNVMNRTMQGRLINFKAYSQGLENTITDLCSIRDADAVSSWLRYRLNDATTGLTKYFNLAGADYALCAARTVTFVNAVTAALQQEMPHAKILESFDIFGDSVMMTPTVKRKHLRDLYDLFLAVCVVVL